MVGNKFYTGLVSLAAIAMASCTREEPKPNFILIQFDDLGWDDLGINGNKIIETPVIDQLARNSVQFSNFNVNPVSAPSRASLLTGRYFLRTGVSHVHGGKDYLNTDETTIAAELKKNGYSTGMWGKWHCGHGEHYDPWHRGFDEAYMAKLYQHRNSSGLLNGKLLKTGMWSDEAIVELSIRFIRKNRKKPFFAYLSLLTCHAPLDVKQEYADKYLKKGLSQNMSILYGMIDHADNQIGRLLEALHEMNLDKNTIVILLSDNGPAINTGMLSDADRRIRYCNMLKGHKGDIWENGVKSPLYVCWKDHLKPHTVNEVSDITDLFPTILELAGITYSFPKKLDGQSLVSGLNEKTIPDKLSFNYSNPGWPPTNAAYNPEGTHNEYEPVNKSLLQFEQQILSVRSGKYKLLMNPGFHGNPQIRDSLVLIDIDADPHETKNIISQLPDTAVMLADTMLSWFRGILEDSSSFSKPVHFIGTDTNKAYVIPAVTAFQVSKKLRNTVIFLKGWSFGGDTARYAIQTEQPGEYQIKLFFKSDPACRARLIISSAKSSIDTILKLAPPFVAGNLFLPAGRTNLELIVTPVSAKCLPESLSEIKIMRRK